MQPDVGPRSDQPVSRGQLPVACGLLGVRAAYLSARSYRALCLEFPCVGYWCVSNIKTCMNRLNCSGKKHCSLSCKRVVSCTWRLPSSSVSRRHDHSSRNYVTTMINLTFTKHMYEGESVNRSHMDIKCKTCDVRTWKKTFISRHNFHQHWYICPIALPVLRNPQHKTLLTLVSATSAPPFQPLSHQRNVFHKGWTALRDRHFPR
jgi:hypothetical protein